MSQLIFEIIFLAILVVVIVFNWLQYKYKYWLRLGVPQITPSMIIGNLGGLLNLYSGSPPEYVRDHLYNHREAANRAFVGMYVFHKPALLIRDPRLVKQVLIRDFAKFSNRYSNSDQIGDPIGSLNVFFLKNPKWKDVRAKLSPFFTSGRLKQMFHLIEEVGREIEPHLMRQPFTDARKQTFILECKEFCALYTTDVIASIAYGIQANSLKNNPNGDFRRHGRAVFDFNMKRAIEFIFIFFLPHWVPSLRLRVLPKDVEQFIRKTMKHVMGERERSGCKRNDLIDILLEFKKTTRIENARDPTKFVFDGDLLIAQAAIFFTAGFETSSATMSFALYELAKNPDVQDRLREEIKQALVETKGEITLKMIDSLEYMGMIICETLRLYPPLPFLDRECTIAEGNCYVLEECENAVLQAGMPVFIPVYGLHMDPKYFPQPEIFDPERFSQENRKFITPYTYMPFGLGPHGCIGERYSMMQIKIGLTNFLRNHCVKTCERTTIPMKFNPKALITQAKDGIYLEIMRDPLNA